MNKINTTLTALALCFASTATYSADSHQTIVDAFEQSYGNRTNVGLIVQTADSGEIGATFIGIEEATPKAMCDKFENVDYATVHHFDGVYRMEACD